MERQKQQDSGTILIAFALFLFILLGFCAIGMETGRWYMVRAELSKSVDAAALVAAKNISNPFVTPADLAREFGVANFPTGHLGTPASGTGAATFTATMIDNDKVRVDGRVSATAILSRMFGVNLVPTASSGVAQKKEVEIMLILDRSGSMSGTPISRLKTAATTFVNLFADTQDRDKMGLISFATSVTVVRPLGTNYVSPMVTAINAMSATGATNPEDAFDQADGPSGFSDQSGVPGDRRIQQFLVFFSDGRPTAFRAPFRKSGTLYDGVAAVLGNCLSGENDMWENLGRPTVETTYSNSNPMPTGNGTSNFRCPGTTSTLATTHWYSFSTNRVPNGSGGYYDSLANCIPEDDLHDYTCSMASNLALAHASELKAKYIKIYTIGLGNNVNGTLMRNLASNSTMYYYAPTTNDLQAIFQRVAQEIKLRLVY